MVNKINTLDEFKNAIKDNCVVDCYATWCGPCRMLAPELEAASESETKIKYYKLDTDQIMDVAYEYSIDAIPCLLFFKDGKLFTKLVGYRDQANIINFIKTNY